MERLEFDSGVKEFALGGGGVLRFNPRDPNLYARFLEAREQFAQMEQELDAKARALENGYDGPGVLALMGEADRKLKTVLTQVLGQGNDLEQALGGVNLLTVADNGQRIINNLLDALQPVLVAGAESYTAEKSAKAVAEAKQRRARRGLST